MIQRKDAIIFLVENEETTTRMLNLWPVYSVISHEFTPFFVGRIQTISVLDKPIVKSEHDTRKCICLSKLPWCSGVVCIHITPYIRKSTALAPSLLLCSSSLLLASSLQQAVAVQRKSLLFSFRNESLLMRRASCCQSARSSECESYQPDFVQDVGVVPCSMNNTALI
jgi:hypothetical protein